MPTLLEKAKKVPITKNGLEITDEIMDVAIAYFRGELSLTQAMTVFEDKDKTTMRTYVTLTRALRKAVLDGKITIKS